MDKIILNLFFSSLESMLSLFDGPINIPGEKHGIKIEFSLLADIIAKPIMDM